MRVNTNSPVDLVLKEQCKMKMGACANNFESKFFVFKIIRFRALFSLAYFVLVFFGFFSNSVLSSPFEALERSNLESQRYLRYALRELYGRNFELSSIDAGTYRSICKSMEDMNEYLKISDNKSSLKEFDLMLTTDKNNIWVFYYPKVFYIKDEEEAMASGRIKSRTGNIVFLHNYWMEYKFDRQGTRYDRQIYIW